MTTPFWLIVRREVTEKLRSRAFRIVNVVLLALVLAATVVPGLVASDAEPDPFRVASVGAASDEVLATAADQGAAFGVPVETVAVDDEDDGRARLLDGVVDAVLVDGQRLVATADIADARRELLDVSRRTTRIDRGLADAGLTLDERRELLAVPPLQVDLVGEDGEADEGPDPAAFVVGFATIFLLYGLLVFYGQQIAQGLVQEKQSRVIEVLLAAVRPIDLLGGKLVGLGLLGLGQIAALALTATVGLRLGGSLDLPPSAFVALAAALPWFLVGYALYATLFALTAAVVPKVEDLQTAILVPILFLVGSLLVAQFAIADPDGTVATVGALVPFSAPIVHPLLASLGEFSWPLAIVGGLGALATTAMLVPVAARVHAGAALSVRSRVTVREALAKGRDD